ncbi:MAG: hypothetical protein HA494_04905 [Thaumarchaeota archaeon]|nr:hypothetical protein [Nitrososphaerota archaeon]
MTVKLTKLVKEDFGVAVSEIVEEVVYKILQNRVEPRLVSIENRLVAIETRLDVADRLAKLEAEVAMLKPLTNEPPRAIYNLLSALLLI